MDNNIDDEHDNELSEDQDEKWVTNRKKVLKKEKNSRMWIVYIILIIILMMLSVFLLIGKEKRVELIYSIWPGVEKSSENSNQEVLISGDDILFTVIAKGQIAYGVDVQKEYKIMDDKTWGKEWKQINSYNPATFNPNINSAQPEIRAIPPLPAVNFGEEMLIVVFQGPKNSGGYDIGIDKIIETSSDVRILVVVSEPGKGCVATQAFTSPYIIVKIKKTDKKIIFKNYESVTECPVE